MKDNKTEVGALFYPTKDSLGNDVPFDSLFIPYIYKEIYLEGVYIDILNGKKDLTVVDVGANIGVTVQYFRQFAKKLYAIEPSPESFEALKKNKEFNNWDNVTLCNYALADKDGEMEFVTNDMNRTMNGLVNSRDENFLLQRDWNDRMKVPTKTFASFMKENNIDEIDFCKFDVEGADDLVLRSEGFTSIASKIKAIEIEFHDSTFPDLVQHMISLGFSARRYPSSAIIVLFNR